MKDDQGYVCISYAPLQLHDQEVTITVTGGYPFSDTATIHIHSERQTAFPITLTVPSWATSMDITMDGRPMHVSTKNHQIQLTETWADQTLEIHFGADIRIEETEQGLLVYRGPLLYALPIKAEESILVERGKFSDKEFRPTQAWNYGLLLSKRDEWTFAYQEMSIENRGISLIPTIKAKGALVKNWGIEHNSAGKVPTDHVQYDGQAPRTWYLFPMDLPHFVLLHSLPCIEYYSTRDTYQQLVYRYSACKERGSPMSMRIPFTGIARRNKGGASASVSARRDLTARFSTENCH
jgi:hypothetical protein